MLLLTASCAPATDQPEAVDDSAEALIAICEETQQCSEAMCEAEWLAIQEHMETLEGLDESLHDQWADELNALGDAWEQCNAPCYSHPSWPSSENACSEEVAMFNEGYEYDPIECAEGRGLQSAFSTYTCADAFASWPK